MVAQGSGASSAPADVRADAVASADSAWPYVSLGLGFVIAVAIAVTRGAGLGSAPAFRWSLAPASSFCLFLAMFVGGGMAAWTTRTWLALPDSFGPDALRITVVAGISSWLFQMAAYGICLYESASRTKMTAPNPAETSSTNERWPFWPAFGLGALALASCWIPLQSIGSIVASVQVWLGGAEPPATGHSTLALLAASDNAWLRAGMIAIAVVLAPMTEEIQFRGAAQQGFRGLGIPRRWAIVCASVLFALFHIGVLTEGAEASGLAVLFALSLLLGWLAERTGRLAAPIGAHAAFNAANLFIAL